MAPRHAHTVTTPSNEDILTWTEENLSATSSNLERRLKPLVAALGLNLLDKDDARRGDRPPPPPPRA